MSTTNSAQDRLAWFRRDRFGMVIHWGLYSLHGRGTWATLADALGPAEMWELATRFQPREFDPDRWAQIAKAAGMRYAVLTSRHHDGFCLFDSRVSDFTSVKTAAGRDFVAEYVEAFRRAGIRVGLYYSLLDWRFPGYFDPAGHPESKSALVQQAHEQVREILTNYGPIDLLWFDGAWAADFTVGENESQQYIDFWRSDELGAMIHELQPNCLINNRSGLPGDFDTPEQTLQPSARGRAWEVCQTIGDWDQSWSHQRDMPNPLRKSADQLILQLAVIMKNNGNLLLNVGPDEEGRIPEADERVLREIGLWINDNGEAVYGTDRHEIWGSSVGDWVFKENVGYFVFRSWPGNKHAVHRLADATPQSATMLATGRPVKFTWQPDAGTIHFLDLPSKPPHRAVTIVKVEFDKRPKTRELGVATTDPRLAGPEKAQ